MDEEEAEEKSLVFTTETEVTKGMEEDVEEWRYLLQ